MFWKLDGFLVDKGAKALFEFHEKYKKKKVGTPNKRKNPHLQFEKEKK